MPAFKHVWLQKVQEFFNKFIFVLWTAILIYSTGPYYAFLELFRNLQIFGFKKLNYDEEFKGIQLKDKVCVITGGTRGIGFEVVKYLLSKNCTIITGTSTLNDNSNDQTIEQFKIKLLHNIEKQQQYDFDLSDRLYVYPLNLSSLDSVAKFSEQVKKTYPKIDFLICNAGVMFVPFKLSHDKFEGHMIINYYSHCLLIAKLLPLLIMKELNQQRSRIIMVSSVGHHASFGLRLHDLNSTGLFSTYHGYCQSKLCQIMFTYQFEEWLKKSYLNGHNLRDSMTINCLHPGMCRTGLIEAFNFAKLKPIRETLFFRSAAEGAETILFTTLSRKVDNISGEYFEDCYKQKSSPLSYDLSLQKQLWDRTWNDLNPWLTKDELKQFLN